MKIAVVGTGYVGLVTGVCLADYGNDVTCIDTNAEKVALLESGHCPIYEPGLEDLLQKNKKRLAFTSDYVRGCKEAQLIFIAVGTPSDVTGKTDLTQYNGVVQTLVSLFKDPSFSTHFQVLINKSTVPVGTAKHMEETLAKHGISPSRVGVVSNPEFLREGSALEDVFHPDRIVLGSRSETAISLMKELYQVYEADSVPVFVTSPETSELIKYAANAFLATKISFINEMALLCEQVGANVQDLSKAIGADSRIGPHFLNPGPGYGGSCFPKDTQALLHLGKIHHLPLRIVTATEAVNDHQKSVILDKLFDRLGPSLSGKTIGILGLAFKANTDDIREAACLTVIPRLLEKGATVKVYDPVAAVHVKKIFGDTILYCSDLESTLSHTDGTVVLTEWNEFKEIDWASLKPTLNQPYLFDTRNLYSPQKMKALGIHYHSLGRPE